MSRILKAVKNRFPDWFRREIDRLSEISRDLADKRAPSLYGIKSSGESPSGIFNKDDAEMALLDTKYVLNIVSKLLIELQVISENQMIVKKVEARA
jgi:HEPN domain-containing protein